MSISLPRPLSVLQKNSSNQGTWSMSGTYTFASSCHLEASDDGVTYTRIATLGSGTGAAWSGTYGPRTAGARKTITVRFEEETTTSATVDCGIGIVFLAAGDSTATGSFYSSYPGYSASYGVSLKNQTSSDDDWFDGNDSGRTDAIRKSHWVVYADFVAQQNACCVGFFYETHGGTDLGLGGGWDATANPLGGPGGGGFLYNITQALTALHGSGVSHVLAEFGPNAIATHPTLAYYKARMQEVGPWFRDNLTGAPVTFWVICGQSGGTSADDPYRDNVRGAELAAFTDGTPNFMGACLIDQQYSDGTHPSTDAQRLAIAQRFYFATKGYLGGTATVRGPRPSVATISGATATFTFDQTLGNANSSSLTAAAFGYTDNGSPVTVTSVTKTTGAFVQETLASSPTGTGLVSFARGDSAAGSTVPMSATRTLPDATTTQTPAEPIYDFTVTQPSGHFGTVFAGIVR